MNIFEKALKIIELDSLLCTLNRRIPTLNHRTVANINELEVADKKFDNYIAKKNKLNKRIDTIYNKDNQLRVELKKELYNKKLILKVAHQDYLYSFSASIAPQFQDNQNFISLRYAATKNT